MTGKDLPSGLWWDTPGLGREAGWLVVLLCLVVSVPAWGGEDCAAAPLSLMVDAGLHHLRREGDREWDDFPEQPESSQLAVRFMVP